MSTLESYDRIPYDSRPVTESHPDALAVTGRLFGLQPAAPEQCRVLELGCASGGNLIPMAFHLPGSEFIGLDLSEAQVQQGQRLIATLGLTNITLLHRDIMAVGEELGQFDYIIAHGVYSWVPPAVQARLLQLCRERLAPQGIAYISYNTLPGWHLHGMTRDMLLYHTRTAASPEARLRQAYAMLDLLEAGVGEQDSVRARFLRQEVEYLRKADPSYLYHEYLEEQNEPVLFSEFIARAEGHGLQYLADSELHTMFASTLEPAAAEAVEALEDQIEQEQYMDFLRLRAFRRSLLCHDAVTIDREIKLDDLARFGVFSALSPAEPTDLANDAPTAWMSSGEERFTVSHPLTKAALAHLNEVFPNAVRLPQLINEATARVAQAGATPFAEQADALVDELFSLYASGGVQLSARDATFFAVVSARPTAHALARAQAQAGEGHAASVRHMSVGLDPLAAQLLALLDGSRTRAELIEALLPAAQTEPELRRLMDRKGRPAVRKIVAASVERLLATFARQGLLIA